MAQLGDEPVDELVHRRCTRLPDNEFRQAGLQIAVELAMQLTPVGGDQLRGIDVWTTFANCRRQLVGQVAVADRQRDAEVIGFDCPAGFLGRPLDRLAARACLGGRQKTAQPTVGQCTDPPKRRRGRAAQPDVQRGVGLGITAAAVTVK